MDHIEHRLRGIEWRLGVVETNNAELRDAGQSFDGRLQLHADLIAAMRQNLTAINLERSRAAPPLDGVYVGALSPAARRAIERSSTPGEIHPLDPPSTVDPIHARAVADIVAWRASLFGDLTPGELGYYAPLWITKTDGDRRKNLLHAAALLLAEIERLDRAAAIAEAADAAS